MSRESHRDSSLVAAAAAAAAASAMPAPPATPRVQRRQPAAVTAGLPSPDPAGFVLSNQVEALDLPGLQSHLNMPPMKEIITAMHNTGKRPPIGDETWEIYTLNSLRDLRENLKSSYLAQKAEIESRGEAMSDGRARKYHIIRYLLTPENVLLFANEGNRPPHCAMGPAQEVESMRTLTQTRARCAGNIVFNHDYSKVEFISTKSGDFQPEFAMLKPVFGVLIALHDAGDLQLSETLTIENTQSRAKYTVALDVLREYVRGEFDDDKLEAFLRVNRAAEHRQVTFKVPAVAAGRPGRSLFRVGVAASPSVRQSLFALRRRPDVLEHGRRAPGLDLGQVEAEVPSPGAAAAGAAAVAAAAEEGFLKMPPAFRGSYPGKALFGSPSSSEGEADADEAREERIDRAVTGTLMAVRRPARKRVEAAQPALKQARLASEVSSFAKEDESGRVRKTAVSPAGGRSPDGLFVGRPGVDAVHGVAADDAAAAGAAAASATPAAASSADEAEARAFGN